MTRIRSTGSLGDTITYKIDGFSSSATTSQDGARIAFLNRRITGGLSRYNLVVATSDGAILQYVDATTLGFSFPAFVGTTTVLANQIFEDRYETTVVDLDRDGSRQEATFYHTKGALRAQERIDIKIEE